MKSASFSRSSVSPFGEPVVVDTSERAYTTKGSAAGATKQRDETANGVDARYDDFSPDYPAYTAAASELP